MEKQYLVDLLRSRLISAGVKSGEGLVAAISGGADSMVLLDGLRALVSQDDLKLVVVHINHGLRASSVKDQGVVEAYCRKADLKLVVKKARFSNAKDVSEEAARLARYKLLRQVKDKVGGQWILTAHNRDDQVETIVFNFLRGSGVRGLGGMKLISEDILRPLLEVSKANLVKYAKTHKIDFATDETNAETKFTRNRIRHQLLPILREYNPAFDGVILNNSGIFQQADSLIQQLATRSLVLICEQKNGRVNISISRLRELLPVVQMEVVRMALNKVVGNLQGIKKIHIEAVFQLIAGGKPRGIKKLPHKLLVEKAYDTITISQERH